MPQLAVEQTFALAMARHPRLGAKSPASALDEDSLRLILRTVDNEHRVLVETKRITCVCVKTGDVVDRVELHYSDGTHVAHGGHGGTWRMPMHLLPGEVITGLSGRKGDSLDAITFTTNRQRKNFHGVWNGGHPFDDRAAGTGNEVYDEMIDLRCFTHPHAGSWLRQATGVWQATVWQSRMAQLLLKHPHNYFAPPLPAPFIHRVGALGIGGDLAIETCTFEQAKTRAATIDGCVGFTFHWPAPTFDGVRQVYFKAHTHGNKDWRWQTYRRATAPAGDHTDWPNHDYPGYFEAVSSD